MVISVRTRSGCAPSLSILLTATTIGTSAAFAWSIASRVCGITPSSAATTITAMSVDLGAAGAHGGERLVARGVEEGDRPAVVVDLVGADVLGDAAGLALGDLGLAHGVQQRRLAVVDVAHDRDDRRAVLRSSSAASSNSGSASASSAAWTISISLSNSAAMTSISSSASVCVSVAISPRLISFLISSGIGTRGTRRRP